MVLDVHAQRGATEPHKSELFISDDDDHSRLDYTLLFQGGGGGVYDGSKRSKEV